jgi:hypothetical protein
MRQCKLRSGVYCLGALKQKRPKRSGAQTRGYVFRGSLLEPTLKKFVPVILCDTAWLLYHKGVKYSKAIYHRQIL